MTINVTKRDGRVEPLDWSKVTRVINWACEGLDDVSVSEIELKSKVQLYDGITTSSIHKMIVKSAADLISEKYPNYQYVASRLELFQLRKEAYSDYQPPSISNHILTMVNNGFYDKVLLDKYSLDDYKYLDKHINHDRDLNFSYAGIMQLSGKYLIQDRVSKKVYESPNMAYMMIAMTLFANEDKCSRLNKVVEFYDLISTFKISLPTPIMAGVRTPTKQFSSCVVIETGDSLNSINASASSVVNYVAKRAGIGLNVGAIRPIGSRVRNGEIFHTGMIPYIKYFQAAVKSSSQGGVRGGAATLFYPIWHYEVESLLVLKNNRGTEDNRARHLDYCVQINKLFYKRLIKGEDITLFSPHEAEGLYETFFSDQDKFEELYTMYENSDSIKMKKKIPSIQLFSSLMQERASTGRIYIQNVDHCNTHSSFTDPIKMSNLCMEITLPTHPLNNVTGSDGEIGLCTLAAVNLGELSSDEELQKSCYYIVRALDNLLDYQDYLLPASQKAKYRRSLGIGWINLAYYLAKNNVKYSDNSANQLVHDLAEKFQYYLLKSSNELAKERGTCEWYSKTKYYNNILPIDTYKKEVDSLVPDSSLKMNWDELRDDISKYGLRHSTLSSFMPSETSSQISNSTNGIEPPRGYISVKASKDGIFKQVVPDYLLLKDKYELLWNIPDTRGYLNICAIIQKFTDQSISANTFYDPSKFTSGKVPMKNLLSDLLYAYKLGIKTLYYHNTRDGASDEQSDIVSGCESGGCTI